MCRMWSNDQIGWKGLYFDVKRWMATDPKLAAKVGEIIKRRGSGRNRLDEGDKGWQDAFCEAFFRNNGNKEKARVESGCPYSLRRIEEMLQPGNSAYDKEFAEKVLEQKLKFKADFEEMALALRDPNAYVDTDASKIAMNKSVVATRILEKVAKEEWGRETRVHGSVTHTHQLQSRYKTRQELLAEMVEDRKRFEATRSAQVLELPANTRSAEPAEDPIDAEVIEE